jgi:hypothetical protein
VGLTAAWFTAVTTLYNSAIARFAGRAGSNQTHAGLLWWVECLWATRPRSAMVSVTLNTVKSAMTENWQFTGIASLFP